MNGYRWVQVDSDGCEWSYGKGGEQKQGKKNNKWVRETYFSTHAHSEKTQEVCRDDHGDQKELFGGMEGEKQARGAIWRAMPKEYAQGGSKKTNNDAKQSENESAQICLTL